MLLGILLGCALGLVLGTINGLMVSLGRVPAIVATLGTLYVYRGLVFVFAADTPSGQCLRCTEQFSCLATTPFLGIPALILIGAAIMHSSSAFTCIHPYRTGVLCNWQQSRCGSPGWYSPGLACFCNVRASGLLSGFAGVLWGARFATVDATAATGLELQVIAAVVVGGVNIFGGSGTILGAVLGAIVLGTLQNALNILNISQFWLQAIYGAAILVAVILDAFITRWLQRTILTRRKKA